MSSSMVHFLLVVVVVVVGQCVLGVVSYGLTISPQHVGISWDPTEATIMCTADVALRACQVTWWDGTDPEQTTGPLLDLSLGPLSRVNLSHLDEKVTGYSYSGRGLAAGDCGVTLQVKGLKFWMVECRVRAERGGWKYAWMDLHAYSDNAVSLAVSPREAIVMPGGNASLLCQAPGALKECSTFPPYVYAWLAFYEGSQSPESNGRYLYHGAGLPSGQCGLSLLNAREADNGPAQCWVMTTSRHSDSRFIPIIVARPPSPAVLEVTLKGNVLQASCSVGDARPVANITWLLGDEVIREDGEDDAPADPMAQWRWPWTMTSITQNLTYELRVGVSGKTLTCRVSHVALATPMEYSWIIPGVVLHTAGCPPLSSLTLVITCSLHGVPVDCSLRHQVGTVARLSCKAGHVPVTSVVLRRLTCQEDDNWNRPLYTCTPDCGRRNTISGTPLVSGGVNGTTGEFPWHVAVYDHEAGSGRNPEQICGGTLISPTIVISAAHCVFNEVTGTRNNASQYKVTAGKVIRQWEEDTDPMVQNRDLLDIHLPGQYHGRSSSFASDIAMLRVATAFQITARVNLACVDWDNLFERHQLRTGNKGIVAGWGFTESNIQSKALKYIELPYASHETCFDSLPGDLQPLMTNDKFCAGFINESKGICPGDSGGGLVFQQPSTGKYFLRGVASVSFTPFDYSGPVCYDQHYGGFTSLSSHFRWIDDMI